MAKVVLPLAVGPTMATRGGGLTFLGIDYNVKPINKIIK